MTHHDPTDPREHEPTLVGPREADLPSASSQHVETQDESPTDPADQVEEYGLRSTPGPIMTTETRASEIRNDHMAGQTHSHHWVDDRCVGCGEPHR